MENPTLLPCILLQLWINLWMSKRHNAEFRILHLRFLYCTNSYVYAVFWRFGIKSYKKQPKSPLFVSKVFSFNRFFVILKPISRKRLQKTYLLKFAIRTSTIESTTKSNKTHHTWSMRVLRRLFRSVMEVVEDLNGVWRESALSLCR